MPGENINNQSEVNELTEAQQGFQKLADEAPFAGSQPETEKNEARFIKLEELENLCSWENCMFRGHGTGRSGDSHEVVESIFREGIRGNHGGTDISQITVGLPYPQGESLKDLKEELDNWKHLESKNIILTRLPAEYSVLESSTRRNEPYFTVQKDTSGKNIHYLDSRLIVGNYNAETGLVELNDKFEPEIKGEFKEEMDRRFANIVSEERDRQQELDKLGPPGY